jgi:D-3-phosphoglycerate dehydrogenase
MTSQAPSIASAGASLARWRATLVDAGPALADLFERLHRADDPPLPVNRQPDVTPDELPGILDGAPIVIIEAPSRTIHTARAVHALRARPP